MGFLLWVVICSTLSDEQFQAAQKAYEDGYYEAAISGFKEVLEAGYNQPHAAEALFYLGDANYRIGQYWDSGNHFREFIRLFPDDPMSGLAATRAITGYLELSDPQLGFQVFEGFPYPLPDSGLAMRLAEALSAQGQLKPAAEVYLKLGTSEAVFAAAKLYLRAGLDLDARNLLLGLAQADSIWRQPAHFEIFNSYLSQGDTLSAIELLPRLRPFHRMSAEATLKLENFLLWRHDLEGAEACLLGVVNDSSPQILAGLGQIYRLNRELAKEAQVLNRLEALRPQDEGLRAELARIRLMQDEPFDRSALLGAQFLDFSEFASAAEKLLERGLGSDALILAQTKEFPGPSKIYLLARVLDLLGRYPEAKEEYERYIEISVFGDSVSAAAARIHYLNDFLINDYPAAVRALLRCTTDAERGMVLFELSKDYTSALPYLELAVEPIPRFYLARAYELLYNQTNKIEYRSQALAAYKDFIDRFPDDTLTHRARFKCCRLEAETLPSSQAIGRYEEFLDHYPDGPYSDSALYLAALHYERIFDYQSARSRLDELITTLPGSSLYPEAIFKLAQLDLLTHDTLAALEKYSLLAVVSPRDSIGYLARRGLARLAMAQSRNLEALAHFKELLAQFPQPKLEDIKAYLELLLAESQFEALRSYLREHPESPMSGIFLARANPDPVKALIQLYGCEPNPEVRYYRGEFAHRLGRLELARTEFEGLLADPKSPWYPKALARLAQISSWAGEFERAADYYQELFSAHPDSIPWLGALIVSSYRAGRIDLADSLLARYQALTGQAGVELRLARVGWLLDQDELLQAQDELSRLLALEPGLANYDEFVYYQALQALKAGNFAQVVQNLTDFESRFPASPLVPQAQFKLGTAYYQLGELSRAAECYRAAAQNEALRVDALSNLAIIYREENRFDEAIEVYKELLKIESLPQRDEFLFRLGYTQLQNHDHQAAALVFNEMLARPLAPERRCEVLHWLGETYLGMGEVSKALFQFLKIPYLYPEEELWAVTAELKAGTCYELMGKPEKARSIYEVVIKRRGETDEWAQEAQRRLKNLEP